MDMGLWIRVSVASQEVLVHPGLETSAPLLLAASFEL